MIFVMAGGGTGGHVIPALAVAEELRARGHQPVFFGTRTGYEARLVPSAGFPLEWVEVGGLNRVGWRQRLRTMVLLPWSALRVWNWMGRHKPAAIFSMGGYVAGPVVLAALLRGIPCVVMEPNAIPGMTNRRMARWTRRALVNFPETSSYFPEGRAEVTGMPVRQDFFAIGRAGRGSFNLLVTGGSQGARTLNNAARECWPLLKAEGIPIRITHQAGRGNADALRREFVAAGLEGEVIEFIADMPKAFAAADLIVARAGASTVSEIAAAGRASVLVPFPYAADDHQLKNAEAMQRAGGSILVRDAEMNGRRLLEIIRSLVSSPEALHRMGESARSLAKPRAAQRAAEVLEEVSR